MAAGFVMFIFLMDFIPFLILVSCFGVSLYMYIQYRKIRDEKEDVMRLQQAYLVQKSHSNVKML
uniref:Uncharacterized protein n=3 Tax=Meloidogyne TaxID=189290 RepID=A0A6V7WAE2_MELEN|nr:unnamed protein product [Meloidogyne enterolobii]CAD2189600.1 unnamed protein product [Meloidogyne enterolobii]